MEEETHDGSLDLQEIRRRVKELDFFPRNCREEPVESCSSDYETLVVQDFVLQFEPKVKEIVEEYGDVDLLDVEDSDAYLEYLRNELQSVEAESAKVSEEIERLSQSHAQDSSRLQRDLEGLLLSLDSMSSQDVEKSKENQPSSSSMEVCEVIDDDKFKMFELENQMEEKRMILKSLEDLDSLRKR
jgi:predicted nuclease with TOPRIM domain